MGLRRSSAILEKKGAENPEGGEYEDMLIAESDVKALAAAAAAAEAGNSS